MPCHLRNCEHPHHWEYIKILPWILLQEAITKARWAPHIIEKISDIIRQMLVRPKYYVLQSRFNMQLTVGDFERLNWSTGAWLNDSIINFYMELINERSQTNPALPKVYAFNSFLVTSLKTGEYTYDKVRRWTTRRKVDLFQQDKVIIPVNGGNHWTLIIVHMDRKKVEYYDSLVGKDLMALYRVQEYLFDEHLNKRGTPWDDTDWDFELTDEPPQFNDTDCGVFICAYADAVARKTPPRVTQDEMANYRQQMMYELYTATMYFNQPEM